MPRLLIVSGIVLILAGVLIGLLGRLPVRFGHLPGDIVVRGRHGVFYFPLMTCLLLSALISLVMWLLRR